MHWTCSRKRTAFSVPPHALVVMETLARAEGSVGMATFGSRVSVSQISCRVGIQLCCELL